MGAGDTAITAAGVGVEWEVYNMFCFMVVMGKKLMALRHLNLEFRRLVTHWTKQMEDRQPLE